MKKLAGLVFAVLLLTALPVAAFADSTVYTEGALKYTIADESITIIEYFGSDEEVHVPSQVAGTPVNVIAAGAFADGTAAKTVYLPDTIMEVQEGAFAEGVTVYYSVPGGEEGGSTGSDTESGTETDSGTGYVEISSGIISSEDGTEAVAEASVSLDGDESASGDVAAQSVSGNSQGLAILVGGIVVVVVVIGVVGYVIIRKRKKNGGAEGKGGSEGK